MSEKRYQISPVELVRWVEPLFGEDEAAEGFPEEQIFFYETVAGIKLPAALREYYLARGRASLNYEEDFMRVPNREAKPFDGNVTFSYDDIRGDLEWLEKEGGTGCALCLWNGGAKSWTIIC
ncbi:MAG: hypothetical protein HFJ80_02765 [Clostridiales bacterium]|nr:hypothetical protein [Clostridiales bacterium]